MSLFGQVKQGDILFVVEEEDKPAKTLQIQEFNKLLDDNRIKDLSIVHKIQIMERYKVITKRELLKLNGEERTNAQV